MRNVEGGECRLSVGERGLDDAEGTVIAGVPTERARPEFVAVHFVLMNGVAGFQWVPPTVGTWNGEAVVVDTFLGMHAMPDLQDIPEDYSSTDRVRRSAGRHSL